jgi:ubiquinone/menaquinone biosynthesis C-methylase UbiE
MLENNLFNQSKQLLAFLRHGDFAHPGEVEAIKLAMNPIAKQPMQHILDVGCGLGGTAHYLQQAEFGKVVGLDIDNDLITYAKKRYVDLSFIHGDVLQVKSLVNQFFQVIYCFSSFFSFPSQQDALRALASVADTHAELVIFDYSRFSDELIQSPFHGSKTATQFNAIYVPELTDVLLNAGWRFKRSVDITYQFEQWYEILLQQFESRQTEIEKQFEPSLVNKMYEGYRQLLLAIKAKKIGGVVVYAIRQP